MASLRPEGALNSAKGLVEIGRSEDALDTLHQVLSNRRYRQWNTTMEKIAEEYIHLCLSVGRPRYAKDGLIQFRNICQPSNLGSLDNVLKTFRTLAEDKVRSTRGKLITGTDGLVDLDETETGEDLLLSALSPDPAVLDERAARGALRDLWEALRTILEVCRNHPGLDETYHATAVKAFEFCSEFKRKNEFRRICETLRLHQQQTRTMGGSSAIIALGGAGGVPIDPLARVIETRNCQMKVAIELGLWSVAFYTADEMYSLLSKKRPSQTQLVSYYSNLAAILWMSSNAAQHQLFHAACLLKLFNLVDGTSAAADAATLAVLASAVPDVIVESGSGFVAEEGTDFGAEKTARLAALCGGLPTRQTLMSDLLSKDLVSVCSAPVASLFAILTSDKHAGDLAPLLSSLPSELEQYVPALRRVALVKLTKEMRGMYSCIGFARFASLTENILPLDESIKLLGQLKRSDQIDVAIDFASQTISFVGTAPSASSGVDRIRQIARQLRFRANEPALVAAAESLLGEESLVGRLDRERRACEDRRAATEARKEALEKDAVRKAQDLSEQLQKAEEERIQADAVARATEQARREAEAKKREEELQRAKAIVERMVATGGSLAADVADLTDEDLAKLGVEKLERLQKEQLAKERADRISKRRNESRRLEHTSRLLRVAGNAKIEEWANTVHQKDKDAFAQIAAEKADEWHKAAASKRAAVAALVPFAQLLGEFRKTKTDEFNHKLAARAEEHRQRMHSPAASMSRDEFKEMAKSLPGWKEPVETE